MEVEHLLGAKRPVVSSSLDQVFLFCLFILNRLLFFLLPPTPLPLLPDCPFLFIAFCCSSSLSQLCITLLPFHATAISSAAQHFSSPQSGHSVTSPPSPKSITHQIKRYSPGRAPVCVCASDIVLRGAATAQRNNRRPSIQLRGSS